MEGPDRTAGQGSQLPTSALQEIRHSNLRIEIKECFQTCSQLLFDLFLAALKHVHGDVSFPPILELYWSFAYLDYLVRRQ